MPLISKFLGSLVRLTGAVGSRLRNLYFRLLGCQIDGYVWLKSIRIPRQWSDIRLSQGVALDEGVLLLASTNPGTRKIDIGTNVYINRNTLIDASESIVIGADTMIGPNCYLTDHDHQFTPGQAPGAGDLKSAPTHIGEKCWIGAGVTVLKGVHIGDHSIVGAGSIVTKDIPKDSLAVGSPAKVIRSLQKENS